MKNVLHVNLMRLIAMLTVVVSVLFISPLEAHCLTIWPSTAVPRIADSGPDNAVELGVRFRADTNGSVTGVRFYKAVTNSGIHVGNLWSATGKLLATATFTGETPSGWQQVNFATPVPINANTTYIASYHTNAGHYSCDQYAFQGKGVDNPPLHALADGVSGKNGCYAYGSSSKFPNSGWRSSNYWVDVVFNTNAADTTPPTVSGFSIPVTASSLNVPIIGFTATDNVGVAGYLITESAGVPPSTASGWSANAPVSYMFATEGNKTLYAWAKDAAGNISPSRSAAVSISLPPVVTSFTVPATATSLTVPITSFTATDAAGVTGYLVTESAGTPSTAAAGWSATAPVDYTFSTSGSKMLYAWARDAAGNVSASRSASVTIMPASGGIPVLVITTATNPFTSYYPEILRAEGLNMFDVVDIASVTSTMLADYDIAILGETALTTNQVAMLGTWVSGGGQLIAMRPDKKLAGLLGLSDQAVTVANGYLLVNTSSGPGAGIVSQAIQYHGEADLYTVSDATSLATLYASATTATASPAVTLRAVGSSGGQAAAFTYDLARSVVYTRQGNPAWAGEERDGVSPIRSDDLFYGAASFDPQPDWVDLDRVAIPQADEQQRLLANLIIRMNQEKMPLPRFWYFPRSLPAVVVMTGDDHGNGGTAGRFDDYLSMSPSGCSVDNWECIRSTSYIYADAPLSNAQAAAYNAAGFEVALHLNTDCADWTPASLASFYNDQLADWGLKYSSQPSPVTHRAHCIAWSDYVTQPIVERTYGIRLDTNYYFWPPGWVANAPGFFTGSGMPMRFADASGNLVDTYQAATQMTDESGQSYPYTIDTLLDRALGPEGYYGAFVVNAHTDSMVSSVSDAVVSSALARGVPVISARQLLKWLDGRNSSSFGSLAWSGNSLSFTVNASQDAIGLTVMVPVAGSRTVAGMFKNGVSTAYNTTTIKGLNYVTFQAESGVYQVNFTAKSDTVPPTVSIASPAGGETVSGVVAVHATATDNTAVTTVEFYLDGLLQSVATTAPYGWTWNSVTASAGTHSVMARAYDEAGNTAVSDIIFVTVSNPVSEVTLVQKASSTTSSAQSLAVALPARVAAGNLIVVCVSGWPNLPAAPAVTDSLGNSYSIAGTIPVSQGAYSAIYYAGNVKGGTDTVTFRTVNANGQISMVVAEFSGIDTISPLDKTSGATGTGTAPSSGTMTPSLAGELVIGCGTHNGNTVTSAGSGFTMIAIPTEDSRTHQPLAMEYQVLSGFQPNAATLRLSAAFPWTQNGALFKPAGQTVVDTLAPRVTAFTIPSTATTLTVPVSSFTATDNAEVSGYLITESADTPLASASGWTATAPDIYTFANAGSKTLYAWARDAAGNVSAGVAASCIIVLQSTGPEPAGWYAGDMHVHRSCGGAPESVSSLFQKMTPQHLAIMTLLADMGNEEVQNAYTDLPLVTGNDASLSTPGKLLHWDAEWHWDPIYFQYPHQVLGGHIVSLGLSEAHQKLDEYTYPIFAWAHQQNAIAGFAHMQYLDNSIPQTLTCCTPLEYPVEVALGTADFISEDVINSGAPRSNMYSDSTIQAYYRLLNCGFRPGLAAGTDYPCNDGADPGSLLTYVKVAAEEVTYRNWIDGIAKGRTVVSRNGHREFLDFKVNNSVAPGEELKLTGSGSAQVTIQWTAVDNLAGTIELVHDGVVVASKQASVASGAPASLGTTVDFSKSGWLAARRMGIDGHQVHTGAIFVTVDNAPVRASAADANFYVEWIDNLLAKTSTGGAWSGYFASSLNDAQARYRAARSIYQQIAAEAAAQAK